MISMLALWALVVLGFTACTATRADDVHLINDALWTSASSFDSAHLIRARAASIGADRAAKPAAARVNGRIILGYSTGGLPIESYTFGNGPMRVAFIGGIHGGAEWNTILLAYAAIDYFDRHAEQIPPTVTLQIIPTANPDGQRLVTGRWGRFQREDVDVTAGGGRFNRNGVDLNRNWGCDWDATAWWGGTQTSGGTRPFSEKETRLLRDFFLGDDKQLGAVQGVVFWHSAVPGVFAGGCDGVYPAAERLATIYAGAANYPHGESFSYYPITGDATNWLSMQQIPAITIELATHDELEWVPNLAGMKAALAYLAGEDQVAIDDASGLAVPGPRFAR